MTGPASTVSDPLNEGHTHHGKHYGVIDLGNGPECCYVHCPDPQSKLEDLDGALLRVSLLISRLRWSSYAGATYGALCALERVLTRYQADEEQR